MPKSSQSGVGVTAGGKRGTAERIDPGHPRQPSGLPVADEALSSNRPPYSLLAGPPQRGAGLLPPCSEYRGRRGLGAAYMYPPMS